MHPDFQCYAANDIALVGPILEALIELQRKTERRLPVLIHGVGNNMHHTVPEQIGDLAEKYPQLTFIVSESGIVPLLDSMIRIAKRHHNIYIELVVNVNILDTKKIVDEIEAL